MDAGSRRRREVSGVLLAGSYGWSEPALARLAPRPLLPVVEQPIASYALRWFERGGIDDVVVCANSSTRIALAKVNLGIEGGVSLRFSEDKTPRGSAGCVKDAAVLGVANTLIVADGTTIPTADLQTILAEHWSSRAAVTLVVHEEPAPGGNSSILVPGGLYVLERRVLEHVSPTGFQDIKEDLIPRLHRAGEVLVARTLAGSCPRVLNALTYLAVNHWVVEVQVRRREVREGYVVSGEVIAHASARIDPDAILVGPLVIGAEAVISSGASLIGPTVIGAGTRVARGVVLSRSVVCERCLIGERAVLDRSVLAADSAVPAHATVKDQVWNVRAEDTIPASIRPRRLVPELLPSSGRRTEVGPANSRQPA
jgi:NDP-sugar pyrophosphorylase family protein